MRRSSNAIFKNIMILGAAMSDEEIEDAAEVFALEDGSYLIVEG